MTQKTEVIITAKDETRAAIASADNTAFGSPS